MDKNKQKEFVKTIENYKEINRDIVYIDESGFNIESPRLYGYSLKGHRCYGTFDYTKRDKTNLIGALMNGRFFAPLMIKYNVDADVFYTYVKEILLKEVPNNSVIVMDNASFHKRADIQELIKNAGHKLLYLPPYSPELNPIEKKWAHIKEFRRRDNLNLEKTLLYFMGS